MALPSSFTGKRLSIELWQSIKGLEITYIIYIKALRLTVHISYHLIINLNKQQISAEAVIFFTGDN